MKMTKSASSNVYGKSVLTFYDQFTEDTPTSIDDACTKLGNKIYELVLEDSISTFVRRAVSGGYLSLSQNDGYVLTEKGLRERENLRKLCGS